MPVTFDSGFISPSREDLLWRKEKSISIQISAEWAVQVEGRTAGIYYERERERERANKSLRGGWSSVYISYSTRVLVPSKSNSHITITCLFPRVTLPYRYFLEH